MPAPKGKRCRRCRIIRPVSEFSPHDRAADRLHSWCRSCRSAHAGASLKSYDAVLWRHAEAFALRLAEAGLITRFEVRQVADKMTKRSRYDDATS